MADTVSVLVNGGPSATVEWTPNMTALNAMERAFEVINLKEQFTYALQFYGPNLGYLVIMINETYDSFISKGGIQANPFFYWQFLVNDSPASMGVSHTILQAGDVVLFEFEMFTIEKHKDTLLGVKHATQVGDMNV